MRERVAIRDRLDETVCEPVRVAEGVRLTERLWVNDMDGTRLQLCVAVWDPLSDSDGLSAPLAVSVAVCVEETAEVTEQDTVQLEVRDGTELTLRVADVADAVAVGGVPVADRVAEGEGVAVGEFETAERVRVGESVRVRGRVMMVEAVAVVDTECDGDSVATCNWLRVCVPEGVRVREGDGVSESLGLKTGDGDTDTDPLVLDVGLWNAVAETDLDLEMSMDPLGVWDDVCVLERLVDADRERERLGLWNLLADAEEDGAAE